jgi:hypothetical protein
MLVEEGEAVVHVRLCNRLGPQAFFLCLCLRYICVLERYIVLYPAWLFGLYEHVNAQQTNLSLNPGKSTWYQS